MRYLKYFSIAILVILIDQATKLLVFQNMERGDTGEIAVIGDFVKLHYTLNEGMAFGLKLGHDYGKLFLTIFRLFAMTGITWFLYYMVKVQGHPGFLLCMALILGGAVGNVIDSVFYGVWLDNAPFYAIQPWGYPYFHGQVIDMFYLDIWQGYLPEWLPVMGGKYMALWPVFNIADAAIFCGVFTVMLLHTRFFPDQQIIPVPQNPQESGHGQATKSFHEPQD